jgi:hypothetical protein
MAPPGTTKRQSDSAMIWPGDGLGSVGSFGPGALAVDGRSRDVEADADGDEPEDRMDRLGIGAVSDGPRHGQATDELGLILDRTLNCDCARAQGRSRLRMHELMAQDNFDALAWDIPKEDPVTAGEAGRSQAARHLARGGVLMDPKLVWQLPS